MALFFQKIGEQNPTKSSKNRGLSGFISSAQKELYLKSKQIGLCSKRKENRQMCQNGKGVQYNAFVSDFTKFEL